MNEKQAKEFLSTIDYLDTAMGMEYCGDDIDFYKNMLRTYVENSNYEKIYSAFERRDWETYRIHVHSLKSSSLAVGAVEVYENAKALENAVKKEDIDFILIMHDRAMRKYHNLLIRLAVAVGRKEIVKGISQEDREHYKLKQDYFPLESFSLPHILVVDDNEMNLDAAKTLLQDVFRISTVNSGEEAFDFLSKTHPDLILLDIHMPDMSGFEVLRNLKSTPDFQEIPVIFLTADEDNEIEAQGFRCGALDFIRKPFDKDTVVCRVRRILELGKLQNHLQREVELQTKKADDRKQRLERLTLQVICALASTVDAKDRYTSGHSMRVARYSRMIAKRMGKTIQEQEDIYYIGMLHDIGKVGIPDDIINKPGKLTDEEFEIIKKHPVIGAEILKNVSEIPGLEVGTRGHHERYDGRGYPDGLKGEDIPEIARIIAVADSYDAMTSRRTYRTMLPKEKVRSEFINGKGTQFDPYIADIMLQIMDECIEL